MPNKLEAAQGVDWQEVIELALRQREKREKLVVVQFSAERGFSPQPCRANDCTVQVVSALPVSVEGLNYLMPLCAAHRDDVYACVLVGSAALNMPKLINGHGLSEAAKDVVTDWIALQRRIKDIEVAEELREELLRGIRKGTSV